MINKLIEFAFPVSRKSFEHAVGKFSLSPLGHPMIFSNTTDRAKNQTPELINQAVAKTLAAMRIPHVDPQTHKIYYFGFLEKCDSIARLKDTHSKLYISQENARSILTYIYAKILDRLEKNPKSVGINILLEDFLELTETPHFQEVFGQAKNLELILDCEKFNENIGKIIEDLQAFTKSFSNLLKTPVSQDLLSLNVTISQEKKPLEFLFPITKRSGEGFVTKASDTHLRQFLSGRISYPAVGGVPEKVIKTLLEHPYVSFAEKKDEQYFLNDLKELALWKLPYEVRSEILDGVKNSMRFNKVRHPIQSIYAPTHQIAKELNRICLKMNDDDEHTNKAVFSDLLPWVDTESRITTSDRRNLRQLGVLSSIEDFEKHHTQGGILCHGTPNAKNMMAIIRSGFFASGKCSGRAIHGHGAYSTKNSSTALLYCETNYDEAVPSILFFKIKPLKNIRIIDLSSSGKVPASLKESLREEAKSKCKDLNKLLAEDYSIDIIVPNSEYPIVIIQNNAVLDMPKECEQCMALAIKHFQANLINNFDVTGSECLQFLKLFHHISKLPSLQSLIKEFKADQRSYEKFAKIVFDRLLKDIQKDNSIFRYIPSDFPNYHDIAMAIVQNDGLSLRYIPPETPKYHEIAIEAIKQNYRTIEVIPRNVPFFQYIYLTALRMKLKNQFKRSIKERSF